MTERSNFARRLAQLRRLAGRTQEDAAAVAGVAQPTWACWESGSREPRVSDLYRIAEALDVEPGELLRPLG